MFDLKEKIMIVAGGGSGIGRAASILCASYGAAVAVLDINLDAAKATAEMIRNAHGRVLAIHCDITKRGDVDQALAQVIAEWGKVGVLFNSVGLTRLATVDEISDDDFDFIVGVNLKGAFVISSAVIRHMKETGGGRIINCASYCGVREEYGNAAYCAAKAGLIMMTRVMALEMGVHNITAVAISPGDIKTELLDSAFQRRAAMEGKSVDAIYARAAARVPVRRLGTVDDIANLVAFLSSDMSSFISGENIMMTGGYVMN